MNPNINKKDFENKLNSLPANIQDIIYDEDTTEKIQKIGEVVNLHIDKIYKLITSTYAVMMGDVRAEEFISHIKKELEIDQETANKIGSEIDQQVFEGVRDAIKSLSTREVAEEKEEQEITPVIVKGSPKPTIADIKTKEVTSSPVQENNYTLDPYREPIE